MRKHLCSIAVLLATMALLCGCGEKPVRSTASAPDSNGVADPKKGFFETVKPIPQEEIDVLLLSGLKPYTKLSIDKLPTLFSQLNDYFQTSYGEAVVDSPIYIFNGGEDFIQLYVHEQGSFHVNEHNIFGFDVKQRQLTGVHRTD